FYQQTDASGLSTNQAWVNSMFTKLNRSNPAEAATLLNNLDAAYTPLRQQAAATITSGTEYRTNLINNFYNAYLGRSAGPGEVSYWLSQFASGFTTEQLQARLLGTVDYLNHLTTVLSHPPSTDDFVTAVYQALFPRYPVSMGEKTFWN